MGVARYARLAIRGACVYVSVRAISLHTLVMCARISLAEMLPLESVSTLLNACSRRSTCGSMYGGWVWACEGGMDVMALVEKATRGGDLVSVRLGFGLLGQLVLGIIR